MGSLEMSVQIIDLHVEATRQQHNDVIPLHCYKWVVTVAQ